MKNIDWGAKTEIECVRDIARLDMLSQVHTKIHDGFLKLKGEGRIDDRAYLDLEKMRSEVFWTAYDYIAGTGEE